MDELRTCRKCTLEFSIGHFSKCNNGKNRRRICKDCEWLRIEAWNKKNPERRTAIVQRFNKKDTTKRYRREWQLLKHYGITQKDYEQMYDKQEGRCVICKKKARSLVVDHDHNSDAIRGLLCGQCNRALGLLKDDPNILRAALSYLTTPSSAVE